MLSHPIQFLTCQRGISADQPVQSNKVARGDPVGLSGFEPLTPALSAQCSNRLSYRPSCAARQSADER